MKVRSKKTEFEHFSKLSNEWWSDSGKFKILHDLQPIRVQYIIDQIKPKKIKDLNILDLGCGGGLVCEPLARLGANVTGIDFVKQNIEVAKQHAYENKLKINYSKQDLNNLKLKNKFDIIIVFEVIEHLENIPIFIKNIKSHLKINGKILISTINRNIFSKILAIYFAENFLQWIPKNTHDYNKLIKPEELIDILKKENFTIKDISGLFFNPIANRWKLSKTKTKINYFCSAILN